MINACSYRSVHRRQTRGFTLLELVIVVTILGTVLASVFAASSVVRYRGMINQASDELGLVTANVRSLYSGEPIPGGLSNCPSGFTTLLQNKLFSQEMWLTSAAAVVNNPFNVTSTTSTALASLCSVKIGSTTWNGFGIRYTKLSAAACSDLLIRNSLPGRDTGLMQIYVNTTLVGQVNTTTATTSTPLPMVPIDATNACTSATANTIDWYYVINN